MKIIGYLIAALFIVIGSVLIFVVGNTDQIISMGINSYGVAVLGLILSELSKKLNQ